MCFRSQVIYLTRFFVHRLSQIACKPFLVLVRRVTLFRCKLVNFCLQRCLIFHKLVYHTATLKWIRKSLDFLRKTPFTAYEFHIIRKSITNRKADRLCRTAFSALKCPKIIPLYPALKSTAWNAPQNRPKSHQFSFQKS